MKTRLVLFIIVGIFIGACAGVITAIVGLEVVGDINTNPEVGQRYIDFLLKSALIWAGIGLVNGLLLFFSSLGKTSIVIDNAGKSLGGQGLEYFDYRHVGAKIIYIVIGITLVSCFWLIPFLAEPNLTEPRSLAIRLISSAVISLTAVVGTFLVVLFVVMTRRK